MIHTMKTIKLLILLLSFAVGLSSLTSCSDDGPEPTPIAEAPVFAMNENFEITAKCANPYKAYVNGIETILPYTITQTYKQQTIVVSGYGYGVNLQNSDTVEQTFVVPALVDNHEYVDLGLPSGTLWATCNVGASSPEENMATTSPGARPNPKTTTTGTLTSGITTTSVIIRNTIWITRITMSRAITIQYQQMAIRCWILRTMRPTSTGARYGECRLVSSSGSWLKSAPGHGRPVTA